MWNSNKPVYEPETWGLDFEPVYEPINESAPWQLSLEYLHLSLGQMMQFEIAPEIDKQVICVILMCNSNTWKWFNNNTIYRYTLDFEIDIFEILYKWYKDGLMNMWLNKKYIGLTNGKNKTKEVR